MPQPAGVPTDNLIELEEEMHNISASSSSSSRYSYYNVPRANMKEKSQSVPRLGYPVPKPRHKMLPKATTIDVLEDDAEHNLNSNNTAISSQYSCLNADLTDPSALVVTGRPDQYITQNRHYKNIPKLRCSNDEGMGSLDSPGELVIQAGRKADGYARTSYTLHGLPENNGTAVMPSNQLHEQNQFMPQRNNTFSSAHLPAHPLSSEIRYPPPMVDRVSHISPPEQEHAYDILRYVSHSDLKAQVPPTHNVQDDSHSNSTPSVSSPHVRRSSGQYAHLIDEVQEKLPQASEELCIQYITKNKGNIELTVQDLKVHILLDMGLENASMENCRKALGHCQWKLDRAAEWLIEQNLS